MLWDNNIVYILRSTLGMKYEMSHLKKKTKHFYNNKAVKQVVTISFLSSYDKDWDSRSRKKIYSLFQLG